MPLSKAQEPQIKENWVLDKDESTATKIYVARDAIVLKADDTNKFRFSAPEHGQSFSAKIDAGLLFPPTENTYADANGNIVPDAAQGSIVGSIPGSASVSPTGGAIYQIPIEVPVGINGMQPQVSVVYNSQGGFGTLGQSWELSGVSAITRGGKSMYYDNINTPVSLESDALYFDGQRLILISGNAWENGATYATEVENYSRIVFTNWGFILTTVDGKTLEFGITTNSRIMSAAGGTKILGWKLNKVTDTYGNSMTYTYTDSGQYLAHINYAGQSVEFAYNHTMAVAKMSYISNFLISQTKLLTAITTKLGTTVLKTVGFSYKSTTDNRLDKISTTAADNSKIKETVVNWGAESAGISQVMVGDNLDYNLGQNKGSVYAGDLNGDGYADRIELWPGSNCDNNGSKGHVFVRLFNATTKRFNLNIEEGYYFCPDEDLNPKLTVGDIDNNGKDEIILYKKNWLVTLGLSNNALIEIHSGISFNLESNHQGYKKERKYEFCTTNVNNDKYLDVVMVFGYRFDGFMGWNDQRAGYTVFTGSATGLTKIYDVSYNNDNAFEDFKIADFDADGKIDVVGKVAYDRFGNMPHSSQSYDTNYINFYTDFIAFPSENLSDPTGYKYTLDYNGDGLPETLIQVGYNGGVNSFVWSFQNKLNNLYSVANPANSQSNPEETYQMYPIDYNGDGLVDLIQGDEITRYDSKIVTNWHFYKNMGNLNFQWEKTTQTNSRLNGQTVFVSDINGDGIADLVFPSATVHTYTETICPENSTSPLQSENLAAQTTQILPPDDDECYEVTSSYTTHEYYAFTMFNATRRNQVISITDGMGQTNSFTYKNFSAYDQTATTGEIRNLKAPILLADTQTEPNGSVTSYTFEKPKVHTDGKGFLGFSTVTSINTQKNLKIKTTYEIEPMCLGVAQATQSVSTVSGSDNISTSSQTNSIIESWLIGAPIEGGKNGEFRYIPIVTSQTSTDKLKNIAQTVTVNYDAYPNITQTTTVTDLTTAKVDLTTKVVTTLTGPSGCLIPYLPATVTTIRTQNGLSDTRIVAYAYEYNTDQSKKHQILKSSETTNSGSALYAVTTEYSNPDTWGHMQTVTVKAKNQNGADQSRSSSVSYSTPTNQTGRFLLSKTNLLGETTVYNWDETHGLLNSETTVVGSINGVGGTNRTTSYTYNSWGQLVETKYPDGIREANVMQWAGIGDPTGAVYCSYSQTSGTAPVKVWYDNLGREIQKDTYGLKGNKISVATEYYTSGANKGKVYRVSEPYFENDTKTWAATYTYHTDYGYVSSVTTPMGPTSTVYDKLTTTVTSPEGTAVTVTNAAGQTLTSKVNNKTVTYTYYPSGLTHTSTPEGGQALSMEYNLQGRRTKLVDPDGGTVESYYDGFGELIWEKQKVHNSTDFVTTTNTYDAYGLLLNINRNGEITTNIYDPNIKDRVNVIELKDKDNKVLNRQTFTYDPNKITDRVTNVQEEIADKNGSLRTYNTGKVYDALGRVKKEIYPSGYYTVNTYDSYSNLTEVRDEVGSGHSIWKADTENALGQATIIYKGAKKTTYEYDPINHQTTSVFANGVVNYTYGYDSKNNLSWRKDNLTTQQEDFGYDELNRLTSWKVTRAGIQTPYGITYDPANLSNIQNKSGIETDPEHLLTMYYGGKNPDGTTTGRPDGSLIGPHALSTISGVPASPFPQADLTVTYTDFKKIASLHEGAKDYELTYGVDDERRMSVYYANGKSQGVTLTRYYVGDYEEEVMANGNIRKIHYLSGAIFIDNSIGNDSLYYTYADFQGSLIALTDADGSLVRRYAYDPWGARRKYDNWNLKDDCVNLIINRGYTGHEHLDAFGIINMNGRVYDPATGMFFSPDPYVQAPGNWLNYNRYSYCSGNPLKYTDPSGNLQLGPFYLSLNIGWSPNGGFSLGVSAGVGVEGWLYAGINVNYGFKNNNCSFTGNVGAGGWYAYGGYDTKAGGIGGAGWAAPSPFAVWSPVSISTNMLSIGIDYSQNGGFSGNYLGMSIASDGSMSFNPSIGVSATAKWGEMNLKSSDPTPLDPSDKSGKPDVEYGDNAAIVKKSKSWFKWPKSLSTIYADGSGGVGQKGEEYVYGKTIFKGFRSTIYLSEGAYKSNAFLFMILQHEFGHVYMNQYGKSDFTDAQEVAAYNLSYNQATIWGMTEYANWFANNGSAYDASNKNNLYPITLRAISLKSSLKIIIPR